jgi:uncharacterized protein (DUF433 family)
VVIVVAVCATRSSDGHQRTVVETAGEQRSAWSMPLSVGHVPSGMLRPPAMAGRRLSVVAFERISVDPARMGGLPTIRDTRVTVGMVLGQLAGGRSIDGIVADYPYLERADVLAALEYAAAAVNEREVPIARPA